MKQSQATKRRAAGIASAKVVIASASLAATVGGWALISATADPTTGTSVASVPVVSSAPEAQQQAPLQPDTNTDADAQTPVFTGRGRDWEWTPNSEEHSQAQPFGDESNDDEAQVPSQAAPQAPSLPQAPSQAAPQSPLQQQQPRASTRSSR